MRKPIFIDRDGVINVDIEPYVTHLDLFQLFPWTVEALRILHEADYDIYVISNQQGVGLGLTPMEEVEKMDALLQAALAPHEFQVKKFYYCTALKSENHPWRKPAPGMILAARDEFGLDLTDTFMIGDKQIDVMCALRAGCRPLLVLSGVTKGSEWMQWEHQPEAAFENLLDAARYVVSAW
ncbi:MAG TPA: HAD-IIIA family hydrolase [Fimbriimonadaceae bacterium]|nr:HAD-IIIA family hydrolase [Fimbriimonadaceae bacterium]